MVSSLSVVQRYLCSIHTHHSCYMMVSDYLLDLYFYSLGILAENKCHFWVLAPLSFQVDIIEWRLYCTMCYLWLGGS